VPKMSSIRPVVSIQYRFVMSYEPVTHLDCMLDVFRVLLWASSVSGPWCVCVFVVQQNEPMDNSATVQSDHVEVHGYNCCDRSCPSVRVHSIL